MQNTINLLTQSGFVPKGETFKWYGKWKPVLNVRKRFFYFSNHRIRVTVGKLTTYFYIVTKYGRTVPTIKFKTRDVESITNYLSGGI